MQAHDRRRLGWPRAYAQGLIDTTKANSKITKRMQLACAVLNYDAELIADEESFKDWETLGIAQLWSAFHATGKRGTSML
jgi:hypothetical protein